MDLKINFVNDCIKLFLFNEKSFKNITKENIRTPIYWLAIPLSILVILITTITSAFGGFVASLFGLLGGIIASAIMIIVFGIISVLIYGLTHLILKAFNSKIKFEQNFKLMLSTYSIGLTIWSVPIFILFGIMALVDPLSQSTLMSILAFIYFGLSFGLSIWYFVVIINYLSKLNKVSKLKTSFAVLVLPIVIISSIVILSLI